VMPSTVFVFADSSGEGYTSPVGTLLAPPNRKTADWDALGVAAGERGPTNASFPNSTKVTAAKTDGSSSVRDFAMVVQKISDLRA